MKKLFVSLLMLVSASAVADGVQVKTQCTYLYDANGRLDATLNSESVDVCLYDRDSSIGLGPNQGAGPSGMICAKLSKKQYPGDLVHFQGRHESVFVDSALLNGTSCHGLIVVKPWYRADVEFPYWCDQAVVGPAPSPTPTPSPTPSPTTHTPSPTPTPSPTSSPSPAFF